LRVKKKVVLFSTKVKDFLRQDKILSIVKNCSSIYKIHNTDFLLNVRLYSTGNGGTEKLCSDCLDNF